MSALLWQQYKTAVEEEHETQEACNPKAIIALNVSSFGLMTKCIE